MTNRPPGVSESLVHRIEQAVPGSWPSYVIPELADAVQRSGSQASDLIPFPSAMVDKHIEDRKKAGASEQEIDEEVAYLVEIYELASNRIREGGRN